MYSIFPKENVFQSTKVYLKRNEFTSSPKENEFQNWIHPGYKGFPQIKCIPQNRMYSKYKAFLESKCIRVQEFSSKDMSLGYMKFPQKRMYSEDKSFPRKKMYSPKRTWLRYRVWRWRLFSSGWKEAVNLRLNHSICWKILKIFRKIWKCRNTNTNMTEEIDL